MSRLFHWPAAVLVALLTLPVLAGDSHYTGLGSPPVQAPSAVQAPHKCGADCAPQIVMKTVMVPHVTYKTITVHVTNMRPERREKTVTLFREVADKRVERRMVTVMVPERRMRTEHYTVAKPVWREVPQQYTAMVPHEVRREGVRTVAKPVMLTEHRTVCSDEGYFACKTHVDACGCPHSCKVWVPNIVEHQVPVTVCKVEYVEQPFSVTETVCRPEVREKMVRVCDFEIDEQSREVPYTAFIAKQVEKEFIETFCRIEPVEKVMHFTAMVPVTEEREVRVPVCTMVAKQVRCVIPAPCCGSVGYAPAPMWK